MTLCANAAGILTLLNENGLEKDYLFLVRSLPDGRVYCGPSPVLTLHAIVSVESVVHYRDGGLDVTEESAQPDSVESPLDLRVVCVMVGALALFAPFLVQIETSRGQATFVAMIWAYISPGPGGGFIVFGLMDWIFLFPFAVWRVVFVYQMVRYYRGRSTRNRTILAGILAEIPMLALYYFMAYIMLLGMVISGLSDSPDARGSVGFPVVYTIPCTKDTI